MKKIIALMLAYSERHHIEGGLTLLMNDDESGCCYRYIGEPFLDDVITFDNIKQLKKQLKK